MKLLKFENYQVLPTEEALLVKPIRDLYNADKSSNKELFMQQISYMYHMLDPRSTYSSILDKNDREAQVVAQEELSEEALNSEHLVKAMEIYEKLIITPSTKALNSMKIALDKVRDFLENVDLFAEDDKGKPKFDVGRIAATMDKVPSLAKKIIETEKIVESEIVEVGRARGGNESKKLFEDGV